MFTNYKHWEKEIQTLRKFLKNPCDLMNYIFYSLNWKRHDCFLFLLHRLRDSDDNTVIKLRHHLLQPRQLLHGLRRKGVVGLV